MVADFPSPIRRTATIQDDDFQTSGTLVLGQRPPPTDPTRPFLDNLLAHDLSTSGVHDTRFNLQIKVCFTWPSFPDQLIEAPSRGPVYSHENLRRKLNGVTEGAVYLDHRPTLLICGPDVRRYIEHRVHRSTCLDLISQVKHGLLPPQPCHVHVPNRKLSGKVARSSYRIKSGIEALGSWNPRFQSRNHSRIGNRGKTKEVRFLPRWHHHMRRMMSYFFRVAPVSVSFVTVGAAPPVLGASTCSESITSTGFTYLASAITDTDAHLATLSYTRCHVAIHPVSLSTIAEAPSLLHQACVMDYHLRCLSPPCRLRRLAWPFRI